VSASLNLDNSSRVCATGGECSPTSSPGGSDRRYPSQPIALLFGAGADLLECVGLLRAFVRTRFGVQLSGSSLRRGLHRLGWRWARPRLAPVRRVDPEAERKVAALVVAWTQVQAGQGQ
jgi:hypothetical protein